MTIVDRLRYDGKRALVVGGATGMGAAAAKSAGELGAEVIVPDYATAQEWVKAHESEGIIHYGFSKKAVNAYVATQGYPLLKKGIRINAICPGPTDTPLAQANKEMWLGFGSDFRGEIGVEASTPLDQAYPLVFLCSDAAVAVTGITMITDVGYMSSGITESFPPATEVANFLLGRY